MSLEKDLWKLMKPNMLGHAIRIENYVGPGQPDVNGCCAGIEWWIELKVIEKFPVRPLTVVRVDHFNDEQRIWIQHRAKNGGRVFIFIRVDKEFFLFNWQGALHIGKDWVTRDWYTRSINCWAGRVDWDEFNAHVLTGSLLVKKGG